MRRPWKKNWKVDKKRVNMQSNLGISCIISDQEMDASSFLGQDAS